MYYITELSSSVVQLLFFFFLTKREINVVSERTYLLALVKIVQASRVFEDRHWPWYTGPRRSLFYIVNKGDVPLFLQHQMELMTVAVYRAYSLRFKMSIPVLDGYSKKSFFLTLYIYFLYHFSYILWCTPYFKFLTLNTEISVALKSGVIDGNFRQHSVYSW